MIEFSALYAARLPVIISEFLAINDRGLADDDGEFFGRMLAAAESVVFADDVTAYYRRPGRHNRSTGASDAALQSKMLATEMIAKTLLLRRNDRIAAAAVRTRWLGLAYYFAQHDYQMMRKALSHARSVQGSAHSVVGGKRFRALAKCIGYRCALELRALLARRRDPALTNA